MKGIKTTSVLFLILILISQSFSIPFLQPVNAETGGELVHKDEIPEGYVGIYSGADLDRVRNDLDGNYILMNDLDLTELTGEGGDFYHNGFGWEPIGSEREPFTGTFDGNGYEISGLQMTNRTSSVGLFGAASQASFKNVGVVHSSINVDTKSNGTAYYGGIIGKASDTTIENSYSGVNISVHLTETSYCCDHSFTGGIAGHLTNTTISNSFSFGNINVRNSQAEGIYTKPSATAGTIAGMSDNQSAISNSYSIGRLAVFIQSYDSSNGVLSKGYPEVTNSYYLKDNLAEPVNDPKAKTLDEMLDPSTYEGFDFESVWSMDDLSEYPFPKFNADQVGIKENQAEFAGGMGTIFSPYKISNANQLEAVADHLNSYFELVNDIDLTSLSAWEPIGTSKQPFTGSFNGNGHSILGLSINLVADQEVGAGLFGFVKASSITDLALKNGAVQVSRGSGKENVFAGGLAGRVESSRIKGISSDLRVSANAKYYVYAGGTAGYVMNSEILDSYNLGEISSGSGDYSSYSGGIAGWVSGTAINRVFNAGKISASSNFYGANTGGITGSIEGTLRDSYNIGKIHASSWSGTPVAGALSGTASGAEIHHSYSIGKVDRGSLDGEAPGGLIGSMSESIVTSSYYFNPVAADAVEDPYFKTKEELQDQSTFEGYDFNDVWKMGGSTEYLFPVLRKPGFSVQEEAESIQFKSLPTKLVYQEGEELDLSGAVLAVESNFLRKYDVPVTTEMLSSSFYPYQPGVQNLSVSYGNFSIDFSVTVIEKDRTAPDMPTVNELTNHTTVVTGEAEPGSTIKVEVGNVLIGRGIAQEDGGFSIEIDPQNAGTVVFVSATDEAGNMSESAIITVKAEAINGWVKKDPGWYYYLNGELVTGWKSINGKWYFMDSTGLMKTGWVKSGTEWYFLDGSGAMKTGWMKSGGKWYYMDGSGAMRTGWLQDGGVWYYFDGSGAMKTGWLKAGGKWYFMATSGAMMTGWIQSGGKWYYFYNSGVMATNTTISGYKLGSDGAWIQ